MPNHKIDMAKRRKIPEIASCNQPCGQEIRARIHTIEPHQTPTSQPFPQRQMSKTLLVFLRSKMHRSAGKDQTAWNLTAAVWKPFPPTDAVNHQVIDHAYLTESRTTREIAEKLTSANSRTILWWRLSEDDYTSPTPHSTAVFYIS